MLNVALQITKTWIRRTLLLLTQMMLTTGTEMRM